MRRLLIPLLALGCLSALVLACYGGVLLRGRQFGYRDSAHFYYPLYLRVQAEWDAGRWPLWDHQENSGMPLVGNPTAAVFYPGKLLYAACPYPWAARLYVTAHTLLAAAGMLVLMRSWDAGPAAATLAALSYAFGMPVLFQYCNVIFLVGAAWLPLGFHGADRWLRRGRRWGLLELAVALAMQTMGGDPESAYVLGVCAGGYALALARSRSRARGRYGPVGAWLRGGRLALLIAALVVVWVGVILLLDAFSSGTKGQAAGPLSDWLPWGVSSAWGLAGLFLLARGARRGGRSPLLTMLAGLLASAVLAAALAAVQLLPILEFAGQSGRAAMEGPHEIFPFSLEPIRLVELAWPNVFGTRYEAKWWLAVIPPSWRHNEVWVPSIYLGGLTLVLALGALGFRDGPPWRGWLSAIAIVSLLASLGEFTGPLYGARRIAGHVSSAFPQAAQALRFDGRLHDGDGSVYGLLATLLPGFRQFRYPSKLLTFATFALAGLAGLGWDRLMEASGRDRRTFGIAAGLLALSLLAMGVVIVGHDRIIAALRTLQLSEFRSWFGPLNVVGSYGETRRALLHATVVLAISLGLVRWGHRAAGVASVVALLVMTADLALANARHVVSVPQAVFETTPKVIRLIEEAERRDPAPGPYRVHRMPYWGPMAWVFQPSPDRMRDCVAWERNSLEPKYGLAYGVEYTLTYGAAELYDYEWFFSGFLLTIDAGAAREIGATAGQKVFVYPRRGFDLWNTRYFVLPAFAKDWKDESRGIAAFLTDTDSIYPPAGAFDGPEGPGRWKRWFEGEDLQVLRNRNAYPRAWVVHRARWMEPIIGLGRAERDRPMQEILYPNDLFWHDPDRVAFDPHVLAWIDADRRRELVDYLPGTAPSASETVSVSYDGPQRVVLDAALDQPGLVVLADVYYPGWHLTIDGIAAPIYRVNRMMRGAAVPAGRHRLVYTYAPRSFRVGGRVTLGALGLLGLLAVAFTLRPVSPRLMDGAPAGPVSTPLPPATEVIE